MNKKLKVFFRMCIILLFCIIGREILATEIIQAESSISRLNFTTATATNGGESITVARNTSSSGNLKYTVSITSAGIYSISIYANVSNDYTNIKDNSQSMWHSLYATGGGYILFNEIYKNFVAGSNTFQIDLSGASTIEIDYIEINQIATLDAPEELITLPGNTNVYLTWKPNPGASGYKVYYTTLPSITSEEIKINYKGTATTTTGNALTIPGLTNGLDYYFAVATIYDGIESTTTSPIEISTPFIPQKPSNVSTVGGNKQVLVQWDNVFGVKSYKVYKKLSSEADTKYVSVTTAAITNTMFIVTGLTNGVSYDFVVTGVYQVTKETEKSDKVSGTPFLPLNPTNVTASGISSNKFTVTWTQAPGATGYKVFYGTSPGKGYLTYLVSGSNIKTITGLTPGTKYYFYMKSLNDGNGESSGTIEYSVTLPNILYSSGIQTIIYDISDIKSKFVKADDYNVIEMNTIPSTTGTGLIYKTFAKAKLSEDNSMEDIMNFKFGGVECFSPNDQPNTGKNWSYLGNDLSKDIFFITKRAVNDIGRNVGKGEVYQGENKLFSYYCPTTFSSVAVTTSGDRADVSWEEQTKSKYNIYFKNQKLMARILRDGDFSKYDVLSQDNPIITATPETMANFKKGDIYHVDFIFDYNVSGKFMGDNVIVVYYPGVNGSVSVIGLPEGKYKMQLYTFREGYSNPDNLNVKYEIITYETEKVFTIGKPNIDRASTGNRGIFVNDFIDKTTFPSISVYFATKTPFEPVPLTINNIFWGDGESRVNGLMESRKNRSGTTEQALVVLGNNNAKVEPAELRDLKYPLDIILCIDTSQSMQGEIDEVKRKLQLMTETLEARGFEVKFNLITFGNPNYSNTLKYNYVDPWFNDYLALETQLSALTVSGGYGKGQENGMQGINKSVDLLIKNGRKMDNRGNILLPAQPGYANAQFPSQKWIIFLTDENFDRQDFSTCGITGATSTNIEQKISEKIIANGIILTGIFKLRMGERIGNTGSISTSGAAIYDSLGHAGTIPTDTGDNGYYNYFANYLGLANSPNGRDINGSFFMYEMGMDGEFIGEDLADAINNVGIVKRWKLTYETPFTEKDGTDRIVDFNIEDVRSIESPDFYGVSLINGNEADDNTKAGKVYTAPRGEGEIVNTDFVNPMASMHVNLEFQSYIDYRRRYGDFGKVRSGLDGNTCTIKYNNLYDDDGVIVYNRQKLATDLYIGGATVRANPESNGIMLLDTTSLSPLVNMGEIGDVMSESFMSIYAEGNNAEPGKVLVRDNFNEVGIPLMRNEMFTEVISKDSSDFRIKLTNPPKARITYFGQYNKYDFAGRVIGNGFSNSIEFNPYDIIKVNAGANYFFINKNPIMINSFNKEVRLYSEIQQNEPLPPLMPTYFHVLTGITTDFTKTNIAPDESLSKIGSPIKPNEFDQNSVTSFVTSEASIVITGSAVDIVAGINKLRVLLSKSTGGPNTISTDINMVVKMGLDSGYVLLNFGNNIVKKVPLQVINNELEFECSDLLGDRYNRVDYEIRINKAVLNGYDRYDLRVTAENCVGGTVSDIVKKIEFDNKAPKITDFTFTNNTLNTMLFSMTNGALNDGESYTGKRSFTGFTYFTEYIPKYESYSKYSYTWNYLNLLQVNSPVLLELKNSSLNQNFSGIYAKSGDKFTVAITLEDENIGNASFSTDSEATASAIYLLDSFKQVATDVEIKVPTTHSTVTVLGRVINSVTFEITGHIKEGITEGIKVMQFGAKDEFGNDLVENIAGIQFVVIDNTPPQAVQNTVGTPTWYIRNDLNPQKYGTLTTTNAAYRIEMDAENRISDDRDIDLLIDGTKRGIRAYKVSYVYKQEISDLGLITPRAIGIRNMDRKIEVSMPDNICSIENVADQTQYVTTSGEFYFESREIANIGEFATRKIYDKATIAAKISNPDLARNYHGDDGEYTFVIQAVDYAGNLSPITNIMDKRTLQIDTIAPRVNLMSYKSKDKENIIPLDYANNKTNFPKLFVKDGDEMYLEIDSTDFNASKDAAMYKITTENYTDFGTNKVVFQSITTNTAIANIAKLMYGGFKIGENGKSKIMKFSIKASDSLGNTMDEETTCEVIVDNKPPLTNVVIYPIADEAISTTGGSILSTYSPNIQYLDRLLDPNSFSAFSKIPKLFIGWNENGDKSIDEPDGGVQESGIFGYSASIRNSITTTSFAGIVMKTSYQSIDLSGGKYKGTYLTTNSSIEISGWGDNQNNKIKVRAIDNAGNAAIQNGSGYILGINGESNECTFVCDQSINDALDITSSNSNDNIARLLGQQTDGFGNTTYTFKVPVSFKNVKEYAGLWQFQMVGISSNSGGLSSRFYLGGNEMTTMQAIANIGDIEPSVTRKPGSSIADIDLTFTITSNASVLGQTVTLNINVLDQLRNMGTLSKKVILQKNNIKVISEEADKTKSNKQIEADVNIIGNEIQLQNRKETGGK